MQFFGKHDTSFGSEYLSESYIYFNEEDKELRPKEFEELIKNQKLKKKNIAGTIFMYNPFYYPLGYDEKKMLCDQDFDFNGEFNELKVEKELTLFKQKIKHYPNMIIELRFLFNLNIANIDTDTRLSNLNADVGKITTNQLTVFEKELNYIDINNLKINGKFVFFAWGNKINGKEYTNIYHYARKIFEKTEQMQKKIAYIYKKSVQEEYALLNLQFLKPIETGRIKGKLPLALEKVFSTIPPQKVELQDS